MTDRVVKARFLIDVAGAVANVGKLAHSINDAAKAGTDFAKKNKQSFDAVGNSLLGIGVTAAAGVGLAVKHFADFDKQMSSVKAATHETAGNMDLLRAAALQAGKDTAFSASEAAQGIENLAKAGVNTKDILGGGLKGALDLAAAGQISVADASDVAATAMTQFNLSGKDVPHIADLLAAGAGKAQGEVSDMAAALKQSGLVASQFGLSLEDTTGTLAAFASAGLIGSDAGTSFKTMLLALANPSKESAAAMKQLGINAYDAQGAFIGIAPLAEQLKTQLSGLTEAQRNAALAQIFGTDAIRAANVLYKDGAAGITNWTNSVNDAGFASDTAKTKTDNLAGDLERLGGAFDTALIQSGSGANTVLRGIVSSADAAVSAFGDLPNAVTGTATALASVVAFGGLAAGGTLKAATAAGQLREAWTGLGRVGRGLTLSMGAVGIALAAAAVIYSSFSAQNAKAKEQVASLRDTLNQATGAITGNTRAYVANNLAQSGLAEKAKGFGLSLSQVTDAALGNKTALDSVKTSLDAVIKAGTTQTNTGRSGIVTQFDDNARAAQDLKEKIFGLGGSLSDAQKQQQLAAEGAKTDASAQTNAAAAHKAAAASADTQTKSLKELNATLLDSPNRILSLRDAQRGVEQAFDDATAAIKENGKTTANHGRSLDLTTQKGRDNSAALDAMAKSANDQTQSLIDNNASQKTIQGSLTVSRARLIQVAQQMGLGKEAAKVYAAQVLAIPKFAKTAVTNNAPAAKAKVDPYIHALNLLPPSKSTGVRVTGASAATGQVLNLSGAINNLPSQKNIYIKMIQSGSVGGIPASVRAPKAAGGPIEGYSPSPTADNIPIAATAGEFMQQVAAVNYYGVDVMHAMNQRRIPKAAVKGYATGGLIGGIDPFSLFSGQFAAAGNPLAGINVGQLLALARAAAHNQQLARANLTQQQRERNAALAAQNRLDAAYKAGANRLATLRNNGASDSAIHAAQAKQIALQNQLNKAKAQTKKENADVSASEKRYSDSVNKSKTTSDAYKDAIDKLNQVKKDAIAFAEQVAGQQLQGSGLTDLFGPGASPQDLLGALKKKGSDLGAFAGTLESLQKAGLSKDLLDQLRTAGPSSAQLARMVLSGGSAFIGQLNQAELALQGQAGRIGAGAAAQQFSVTNLTTNIQIGNEVVRVVKQVLAANNAALKRKVG